MNARPERPALLDELASRGVRITAQRRALVEVIQSSQTHLDPEALLEQARRKAPNIDRATVYRTLGLLRKLRLKHYFEARPEDHRVHLTCFYCGRIEEVPLPAFEHLKSEIAERTGFAIC
ncbi:MAG TPA: transcriptional repressor, partial [Bryobacteraceae bacterium]|nr:transcriptional repressor [Bryobacteraceae bacterium]